MGTNVGTRDLGLFVGGLGKFKDTNEQGVFTLGGYFMDFGATHCVVKFGHSSFLRHMDYSMDLGYPGFRFARALTTRLDFATR